MTQAISQKEASELMLRKFPDTYQYHSFYDELDYYAWPVAYGTTAGPFGGCGGCMITTFTLETWTDGYHAVIFCGNKILKVLDKFEPMMRV